MTAGVEAAVTEAALANEVAKETVAPPAPPTEEKKTGESTSFKEEIKFTSKLSELQRKALEDLKKLVEEALNKNEFTSCTENMTAGVEAAVTEAALANEAAKETVAPPAPSTKEKKSGESPSFKEESKFTSKLSELQRKALDDLKKLVEEALNKNEFTSCTEKVFIWGIPLLGDERSNVILLKFLRARDFKVKETLAMIKECVRWRKEFGIDSLLDEDLGNDYEKVVFNHGCDKKGRPVVYNVFGEFNDKDLYQLAFSDAEKQIKFLKWLVQFVERTVRRFEFSPEGMNSFLIVNDLENSPGYGKRELHKIFGKYMMLLQDNYPEFVSKAVCINVSFWYLAYSWVYVNVLSPRSKSKFDFATSSKTPDTLFRYISREQVPVKFGGNSKTCKLEFTHKESGSGTTEVMIKPSSNDPTEVMIKPSSNDPTEFRFTKSFEDSVQTLADGQANIVSAIAGLSERLSALEKKTAHIVPP